MTAPTVPARRGRPSADEVEASTLAGRLAHALEGHLFGTSAYLVYARATHPKRRTADHGCDTSMRCIQMRVDQFADHPDPAVREMVRAVQGHAADYWHFDRQEDAEGDLADQHERQAHNESRMGAGTIEALLSNRARGRAARRPTAAMQMPLGEIE